MRTNRGTVAEAMERARQQREKRDKREDLSTRSAMDRARLSARAGRGDAAAAQALRAHEAAQDEST